MTDTRPGVCRYCGQADIASAAEHDMTPQERDIYATRNCTCDGAREVTEKEISLAAAQGRINDLFGEGAIDEGWGPVSEEAYALIEDLVKLVADDSIRAATVQIDSTTKAKVAASSKGTIKIERIQTEKSQREI